jgi:hypothetical protein
MFTRFVHMSLLDFLQQPLLDVHLSSQQNEPVLHQVMPSAASSSATFLLSALCSLPLCNTLQFISHLLSIGRQFVRAIHQIVPSTLCYVFLCSFFLDTRMGGVPQSDLGPLV